MLLPSLLLNHALHRHSTMACMCDWRSEGHRASSDQAAPKHQSLERETVFCLLCLQIGFGGCWDCAAAALVVSEAGGRVLDPAGGPFGLMSRRVLATNAQLGDAVSGILAECKLGSSEPAPLDAKK